MRFSSTVTMVLDSKTFRMADQEAFAALSLDWNPMHMDDVYARRTLFGQAVVHGIHGLLWALDGYLRHRPAPVTIAAVRARFRRPLPVDATAQLKLIEEREGGVVLSVEAGDQQITQADFTFTARPLPEGTPESAPTPVCPDLSFAEAAACGGTLPLAVDRGRLERLLPSVARLLPTVQAAELLASTRLVGMVCPGLHSLFSGLQLAAAQGGGAPEMKYSVRRSNPKTGGLDLTVAGPSLEGLLNTFVRPRPQPQPSLAEIGARIEGRPFAGQRALVVGGSRGLGEVTAKCIAAGGGSVAITYRKGAGDANRLVEEMTAAGVEARAIQLDCTAPAAAIGQALASQLEGWAPPTHLYFFATPVIPVDAKRVFSAAVFQELARYYVEGFGELVQAVYAMAGGGLTVLYPSTVFLEEPEAGTGEYCAAKAAGEALCRHLEASLPNSRFFLPRLPRMRTDQTVGIMPMKTREAAEVMAEVLLRMPR